MSGSDRKSRGRNREGAFFPAPSGKNVLPADYATMLEALKERIRTERLRITLAANTAMVQLYWDIGRAILERQQQQGWGAKVIDRLSHNLTTAFPDMTGLSPRNLLFMRSFAEAYPDPTIVKQLVSQIPWGHIIRILQKVKDPDERLWYVRKTIENGWSRNILAMQIETRAHQRQGKAINNFDLTLPPPDSDLATQVFKDPYLFDFLGTADPRREREVEQSLVDHIQHFLLELGAGTGAALIGRIEDFLAGYKKRWEENAVGIASAHRGTQEEPEALRLAAEAAAPWMTPEIKPNDAQREGLENLAGSASTGFKRRL